MSSLRVPHALPPDDSIERTHELTLPPSPGSVAQARAFVQQHAPDLPHDTQDALLLLTSELVTNAVLHARSQVEVALVVALKTLVVTVDDLDLTIADQEPYAQREGGWGLGLVGALAQESGMHVHPEGGKSAWFRLPRGPGHPVADSAAARKDISEAAGRGADRERRQS